MTDKQKPRCCATVHGDRCQSWTCCRYGVVEVKGRWYCKQHSPAGEAARKAKQDARYAAQREAWNASFSRKLRAEALMKLCDGLTLEQVEAAIIAARLGHMDVGREGEL